MASLNKVFLIGNLTRDPEIRYTPGGAALCALGLAVNRKYTTANGEERSDTCFIDIEVWGKQAESCNTYLKKGAPAFVEGRLKFDQWDDRESGRKRSRITVTGERIQFLGAPSRGSEYSDTPAEFSHSDRPPPAPASKESAPPAPPFPSGDAGGNAAPGPGTDDESMDDIPF